LEHHAGRRSHELTISGERSSEHEERGEGFQRIERAFGSFSRTLTLPRGIEPGDDRGGFQDGVLEVRIPKPDERKPRRISIGLGDTRTHRGQQQRARCGRRAARRRLTLESQQGTGA